MINKNLTRLDKLAIDCLNLFFEQKAPYWISKHFYKLEEQYKELNKKLRTCKSIQKWMGEYFEEDCNFESMHLSTVHDIFGELVLTISEQYQIDFDYLDYFYNYFGLTKDDLIYYVGEDNYNTMLEGYELL